MENYEQLKSMYKSGRYECDLPFYNDLIELVSHLNLYSHLPAIEKNRQIVVRTSELTKRHLKLLEDEDNEEKALEVINEINRNLANIDTNCVKNAFQEIEVMNGKSYEERLIAFVKEKPYKRMYLEILDRIINSVHNPQTRFEDMLVIGIFMHKNHEKVSNFVQIYNNVLENGVNELRKFRQNQEFIKQNPEVSEDPKVINYLKGAPVILDCLFKFNEIYKLLSGDSKFGLKLNALKKDLFENQKHEETHRLPIAEFKKYLLNSTELPNICSLSLLPPGDNYECVTTIKLLYHQKTQA